MILGVWFYQTAENMDKRTMIVLAVIPVLLGLFLLAANRMFGFSLAWLGFAADSGSVLITPRTNGAESGTAGLNAAEQENASKPAKEIKEKPKLCQPNGVAPLRGSVIISEVAWMGTQNSYSDEWIELKNISAETAHLTGWQLQNKKQRIKIIFETEKIAPGGFFLLERTDDESVPGIAADRIYSGSLANSGENLYLFDGGCVLQDEAAAASKWPAGDNVSKLTMERTADFLWISSKEPGGTPKR